MRFVIGFTFFYIYFSGIIHSADKTTNLADEHAPISVMGDHIHKEKDIMLSYRLGKMSMGSVYNGRKILKIDAVLSRPNSSSDNSGPYMNAPISMNMIMHMFGLMYAPTDNLTIMMMGKYFEKEMTLQRMKMAGSARFDVNSSGLGDTSLSFLIRNNHTASNKSHFGFGFSFPTGSIDCRDTTPASINSRLGYAMQNGTGTFDPFLLYNNLNQFGRFKIGEQIHLKIPASGKNNKDYEYGKSLETSIWASYRWLENVSNSIRLSYHYLGYMKGSDNEMNPKMSPSMDSKNSGYQKLNFSFGVNFVNYNKKLNNHRLGLEATVPVYQKYRGLQMGEKFKILIGWQFGI